MIKSNNNLGYITPGILQVEDFQNIKEYSSYMMPNNIVLASYQMNIFKDYREYSGYSYELYYLDDHSYVSQLTYNILPGNGLVIDENGLMSIEIDNHTLQKSEEGLFVNTYNLNTAYSYYQKGLIVGDNINYRNFFSNFKESGFTETRNGIASLNHGFIHEILDIKNLGEKIDAEIENINNLLLRMFNSRKYYIGDILYFDTNSKQLVDEHNSNAIPYMICVISSDTTDDKLPRFIKIEEKNYYYPQSSFTSELENIDDLSYTYFLNTYTFVPIYDVPWSQLKPNSNIIYGTYGFIALDRSDWVENFVNPFNYDEHYYCNAKEKYTGWYLDASYVSYNNPTMQDWLVQAGGFYTYNISTDIIKNVENFYDLTDDICVIYNNIIKHYKVEFRYDRNNNKYISKADAIPYSGTGGVYTMSENSIAMNITWSNILKNPYQKENSQYVLSSAFIPYREVYDYKSDKLVKNYINVIQDLENNSIETISSNLEYLNLYPDKYDWEWKQDVETTSTSNFSNDYIKNNCKTTAYLDLGKLVDKTGIPNIGLKIHYTYSYGGTTNSDYKYEIDYEYFIYKCKYYSYKFTSKDQFYLKKNKNIQYYTDSNSYITRLYDMNSNFINWESSYNYELFIPNCHNYNSVMESNKPTITISAYNLNDLSLGGISLGKYALNHKSFKDYYGNETISYFYMDLGGEKVIGNGLGQNYLLSNSINKELRDYRLAIEGSVYFKPDYTYITSQQSENEYLLHYTVGNIIGNILDYRSTFIDYYLFANKAEYRYGKCNVLSTGCIWLYDPYKILNIYENQNILISLNVYSSNEAIFINKLFKFKIEYDSTFNSYMYPDWYDANTNEYLLQCEQADIDRITFNYAIDFDSYDKHKRTEELDDVPLAPEGTVIYIPPEPVEEPQQPDDGGGGTPSEPAECQTCVPNQPVEMWIVEDYVEKEDDYVFLHDMAIGMKFKESDWGDAMVNGSRRNLKLGNGGNIYILYFEMQYPDETKEISGKKYVAFTYRNYSDSKGYVLKLCVNETIAINKYDKTSWSKDTNSIIPDTRNEDLLKFNLEGKSIKEFFVTSQFKFELIGIGLITSPTQLTRYFIEVEDTKYNIDTYYTKDKYEDKNGTINMTERVTVWNAFKYYKTFNSNPPHNNFGTWPKTEDGPDSSLTSINNDGAKFNMTLGKLYKTKDSNSSVIYIGSKYYNGGSGGNGYIEPDDGGNDTPAEPPASIDVNGVTYYKDHQTAPTPAEDYEEKVYHYDEFDLDYYAWVLKSGHSYEEKMLNGINSIKDILSTGLSNIASAISNGSYTPSGGNDNPSGDGGGITPSGGGSDSNALQKIGNSIFSDGIKNYDTDNSRVNLKENITISTLQFDDNIFDPSTIEVNTFEIKLGSGPITLIAAKSGNKYGINSIKLTSGLYFGLSAKSNGFYQIDISNSNSSLGGLNNLFDLSELEYELNTIDGYTTCAQHGNGNLSVKSGINSLNITEFTTEPTNFTLNTTDSKLTFDDSSSSLIIKFKSSTPTETIKFGLYNYKGGSGYSEFNDDNDGIDNNYNECLILFNGYSSETIAQIKNSDSIYDSTSGADNTKIYFGYLSDKKSINSSGHDGLTITYSTNTITIDGVTHNITDYVDVKVYDGLTPTETEINSPYNTFNETSINSTYAFTGYIKVSLKQSISCSGPDLVLKDKYIQIKLNNTDTEYSFKIKFN